MLRRKISRNYIFYFLWAVIALAIFQNCSGGFKTAHEISPSSSLSSASNIILPLQQNLTGSEMQPLQVQVQSNQILSSGALPVGARFDSAKNILYWIPQKGQAGTYSVDFLNPDSSRLGSVAINILAVSDSTLQQGPVDGLQDGDVGYIFVHGMGSVDRCANTADLAAYWGSTPSVIDRSNHHLVACYDSRASAESVAPKVAQQILDADCGSFNKCVIITHSMGGLVIEHILTHARAATSTDPEPALFANAELYKKVKLRILNVISIASAAGGSKAATILTDPSQRALAQQFASYVVNWMGESTPSSISVTVARASNILAPMSDDPGIPIYMVPGFTMETTGEHASSIGGIWGTLFNDIPLTVYQGDSSLATLDPLIEFDSRSDGLVDFRSSCAVMSNDVHGGNGYWSSLAAHLSYCYNSAKKPNHYVWFLSNMNHYLIQTPWPGCANTKNPCMTLEPNSSGSTYALNPTYTNQSTVSIIRKKLDANRLRFPTSIVPVQF